MNEAFKSCYVFGDFRLDGAERRLLRSGAPIPLPPKILDTLLLLVENAGHLVEKDEFMKQLWPGTFVGEDALARNISILRKALGESSDSQSFIATVPTRGYRFVAPVQKVNGSDLGGLETQPSMRPDSSVMITSAKEELELYTLQETTIAANGVSVSTIPPVKQETTTLFSWRRVLPIVVFGLVAVGAVLFFPKTKTTTLAASDLVLVSDFVNTTGEPIFDGSLKQAVSVKLAESPYFNILPEFKVKEALSLMGRSPNERVVPPVAQEVCQRAGAKVAVLGSIVAVGEEYMIDLRAMNCFTGTQIVHQESEAQSRDRVLSTLGQMIPPLRQKLGELVSSIQKFNTPIEQATTKSLAALKAYTSGDEQRARGGDGVPFYKMAIDLDPDFAIAYARLGAVYSNLANSALADEYMTKAFQRREHVSEREKFYIAAHYYADSTRESDKAMETLELWAQTYPHDWVPFNNLSAEAVKVGQLDEAIKAGQEALRLNPGNMYTYFSLSTAYLKASHFVEAKAICDQAIKSQRDSGDIHGTIFTLAFVDGDKPEIQRQVEWVKINENPSPGFLNTQAWMAFALGQARRGRDLFQRSRAASLQQANGSPVNSKDYAAFTAANEAHLEMELGNFQEARAKAELALRLMPSSVEVQSYTALVFTGLGDFRRAGQLTDQLTKRFPSSTLLANVTLPTVQAITETQKRNYKGAINALSRSLPYDLGSHQDLPEGVTLYHRGLAYLALGSGDEAAVQFQKLLDNQGIIVLSPYWPLAHLGLARANALKAGTGQGVAVAAARARALAAYQEFYKLWKDADPDIPILKQAKKEYAKLQ